MPSALFVVTAADKWTLADGGAAYRLLGRRTDCSTPRIQKRWMEH